MDSIAPTGPMAYPLLMLLVGLIGGAAVAWVWSRLLFARRLQLQRQDLERLRIRAVRKARSLDAINRQFENQIEHLQAERDELAARQPAEQLQAQADTIHQLTEAAGKADRAGSEKARILRAYRAEADAAASRADALSAALERERLSIYALTDSLAHAKRAQRRREPSAAPAPAPDALPRDDSPPAAVRVAPAAALAQVDVAEEPSPSAAGAVPAVVERIVEVPVERIVERIVEVPVDRVVEKIVEVPVDRIVERTVEVPVDRVVERIVEVPVERVVEKIVEVPVDRVVEKIVEVPVERVVEKIVEVPVDRVVERIVEVPVERVVYRDREVRVEVPFDLPTGLTQRPGLTPTNSENKPKSR